MGRQRKIIKSKIQIRILRWDSLARVNISRFVCLNLISLGSSQITRSNPHATGHFWCGLRNKHSKNWFTKNVWNKDCYHSWNIWGMGECLLNMRKEPVKDIEGSWWEWNSVVKGSPIYSDNSKWPLPGRLIYIRP